MGEDNESPIELSGKQVMVRSQKQYGTITNGEEPAKPTCDIRYGVEDVPPWYMCISLGMQHYLLMFGTTLAIPYIIATAMCIDHSLVIVSEIISTIFFVGGIITLMQTTFGVRLAIVQGGTFSLVAPTLAILHLEKWQCTPGQDLLPPCNSTIQPDFNASFTNCTIDPESWKLRMCEIQGAIIMSSLFQVCCGFSGLVGVVLKYIGPLAIAPTVSLIGLSLFETAATYAAKHWWIAMLTTALITIFSMYMRNVHIPWCGYTRNVGCQKSVEGYPVFQLFPVMLAIVISWVTCAILTFTNVLPNDKDEWGYGARIDARSQVLQDASWFRIPYPGQWGTPTISASSVVGMIAGVTASMIESVGDYYTCARLSAAPPPPSHAVSRGIGVEGIGGIIAGLWGSGNGTTSYSGNIGAIGITKVASRRVIQTAGIMICILATFGKFGALFVTIPEPIVGGIFFAIFGMITAVGISNLQYANLNSSRNLYIFGVSMFLGLALPQWLKYNPGAINTGEDTLDNLFTVLGTTMMFVGGMTGFFLDNTIPGTPEERGIISWRKVEDGGQYKCDVTCYDLPFGMSYISKWRWTKYLPFCPTFRGVGLDLKVESEMNTSV